MRYGLTDENHWCALTLSLPIAFPFPKENDLKKELCFVVKLHRERLKQFLCVICSNKGTIWYYDYTLIIQMRLVWSLLVQYGACK